MATRPQNAAPARRGWRSRRGHSHRADPDAGSALLLSHVWGYDYDPGSNVVDVYIGYLRRKLGEDVIETVRGMGYRLRD